MVETTHACRHCGPTGFWAGLLGGLKRAFGGGRDGDRLEYIPVDEIRDNPHQPREYVLHEEHDHLKQSIGQYGVIVPIIVNRSRSGYVLIAGQRRLLAARELGMKMVPAIVRSLSTREMMHVATLENLHRQSLSPIDLVLMLDRIRKRCPGVSEEDLARTMGLKTGEVQKARSLLDLPIPVQEALRAGMIGEAQARIVAEVSDPDVQLEIVELVYNTGLADEDLREMVDRINRKEPPFVTSDGSAHYHAGHCPYALLIPENRRTKFYSKKEAGRLGKIACMNCL